MDCSNPCEVSPDEDKFQEDSILQRSSSLKSRVRRAAASAAASSQSGQTHSGATGGSGGPPPTRPSARVRPISLNRNRSYINVFTKVTSNHDTRHHELSASATPAGAKKTNLVFPGISFIEFVSLIHNGLLFFHTHIPFFAFLQESSTLVD